MQQSRLIVLVLRLALHLDRLLALVVLLVLLVQMAIGPLNAQEWLIGKDRLQNGRNAVVNVGVFDRIIGRASNKDGQQLYHCLHRMNVDMFFVAMAWTRCVAAVVNGVIQSSYLAKLMSIGRQGGHSLPVYINIPVLAD